jgi:hypothetical protein
MDDFVLDLLHNRHKKTEGKLARNISKNYRRDDLIPAKWTPQIIPELNQVMEQIKAPRKPFQTPISSRDQVLQTSVQHQKIIQTLVLLQIQRPAPQVQMDLLVIKLQQVQVPAKVA